MSDEEARERAEAEANSAMIQQLLMQDQLEQYGGSADPYGEHGSSSAEDFDPYDGAWTGSKKQQARRKVKPSKPKPKPKPKPKRVPKVKAPPKPKEPRPKKAASSRGKDALVAAGKWRDEWREGKWQADEEERFKDGLELFGRNWKEVAEHVRTRPVNNVKSHAQKYFISLWKAGTALPAKVQETGAGHTLSGKELDPESAAARQYTGKRPASKVSSDAGTGTSASSDAAQAESGSAQSTITGSTTAAVETSAVEVSGLTDEASSTSGESHTYMCSWDGCSKTYATKSSLSGHVQDTHAEKNFKCTVEGCASAFGRRGPLQIHLRRVHKISPDSENSVTDSLPVDQTAAAERDGEQQSETVPQSEGDLQSKGASPSASTDEYSSRAGNALVAEQNLEGSTPDFVSSSDKEVAGPPALAVEAKGEGASAVAEVESVSSGSDSTTVKSESGKKRASRPKAAAKPTLASQRTRRKRQGSSLMANRLGSVDVSTLNPLQLVPCMSYRDVHDGSSGRSNQDLQPFSVIVEPGVLAVVETHGHLCTSEIIGLLAGTYDAVTRCLRVTAAVPCDDMPLEEHSDSGAANEHVNVEMEPTSQLAAAEAIAQAGSEVVGWYHTHPVFEPQPSVRDVQNQQAYQALYSRDGDDITPFVGIILSPYDLRLPTDESAIRMFHVVNNGPAVTKRPRAASSGGDHIERLGSPHELQFEMTDASGSPENIPDAKAAALDDSDLSSNAEAGGVPHISNLALPLCARVEALIGHHTYHRARVTSPSEIWRLRKSVPQELSAAATPDLPLMMTRQEKLLSSLTATLQSSAELDAVVASVSKALAAWPVV